jgi:hypothetical protein
MEKQQQQQVRHQKNESVRIAQLEKMCLSVNGKNPIVTKKTVCYMDESSVSIRTLASRSRRYYGNKKGKNSEQYLKTLQVALLFTEYQLPITKTINEVKIIGKRGKRDIKKTFSKKIDTIATETYCQFKGTVRIFEGNMNKLTEKDITDFVNATLTHLDIDTLNADARPNTVKASQKNNNITIKSKYFTQRIDAIFGSKNVIYESYNNKEIKDFNGLMEKYRVWIKENGLEYV